MTQRLDEQKRPQCPKCGDFVWRDSVDVGVGVIHGPFGCPSCGWSESPNYDRSNGESPAEKANPDHLVDQWGGLHPNWRLRERLRNEADNPTP